MKFLRSSKNIILKLVMVVMVHQVLEEKNLLNMVDQMVVMVEKVVQ